MENIGFGFSALIKSELDYHLVYIYIVKPLGYGRFSERGVELHFLIFFHRGIRNKKVCKVKKFQVLVPHDNFEYQAKTHGLRG